METINLSIEITTKRWKYTEQEKALYSSMGTNFVGSFILIMPTIQFRKGGRPNHHERERPRTGIHLALAHTLSPLSCLKYGSRRLCSVSEEHKITIITNHSHSNISTQRPPSRICIRPKHLTQRNCIDQLPVASATVVHSVAPETS